MDTAPGASRLSSITRRRWLRILAAGAAGSSVSGWLETLADDAAAHPARRRSCILLWMNGGPSQIDTFDLKPGHNNGGSFRAIETAVPGIQISEHLPKLAARMNDIALVRSMSTKEGDHGRATYHLRTGYKPQGPVHYPALGALVAKDLADPARELPSFVSILPDRDANADAYGPGFLGHTYSPLIVGDGRGRARGESLKVEDLDPLKDVDRARADARLLIRDSLDADFLADRSGVVGQSHRTAYDRAVRLMRSASVKAFDLNEESKAARDQYGRN